MAEGRGHCSPPQKQDYKPDTNGNDSRDSSKGSRNPSSGSGNTDPCETAQEAAVGTDATAPHAQPVPPPATLCSQMALPAEAALCPAAGWVVLVVKVPQLGCSRATSKLSRVSPNSFQQQDKTTAGRSGRLGAVLSHAEGSLKLSFKTSFAKGLNLCTCWCP